MGEKDMNKPDQDVQSTNNAEEDDSYEEDEDDSIDPVKLQTIIEDYCEKDIQGLFRLYVRKNERWQGAVKFLDRFDRSGWKILHELISGRADIVKGNIDPYDNVDLIQPLLEKYQEFFNVYDSTEK